MVENEQFRVLHICPDYPHTKLYHNLIKRLEGIADNIVYVSQTEVPVTKDYPVVFTGKNFGVLDRILFWGKQRQIIEDIKAKGIVHDVNVIHAHNLFSAGYVSYKLSQEFGIPYVVAIRNTDVNVFFHYMIHLRRLGVKVMEYASAVIFISPAYKEFVINTYVPRVKRRIIAAKSFVIPNGIDDLFLNNVPKESKHLDDNKLRLIYVGEVNCNKNLTATLKACKILQEKGYKPSIKVVGRISDPKLAYIKESPFVEYHEHCEKEEVIGYYRQSDIFVMPSLKETFGLVYAEALSQGLPIIYSLGQGIDGYFPEGLVGFHVRSKHPEDIACSIEKIVKQYKIMSEHSVVASQQFRWEVLANIYGKMYRQFINK